MTMRATILLMFLIYISSRFIRKLAVRMISYMACTVVMFGIPLSRLFLEAHFLSDTIAAMSISIAWFCLCLLVFREYNDRKAEAVYLRWYVASVFLMYDTVYKPAISIWYLSCSLVILKNHASIITGRVWFF